MLPSVSDLLYQMDDTSSARLEPRARALQDETDSNTSLNSAARFETEQGAVKRSSSVTSSMRRDKCSDT